MSVSPKVRRAQPEAAIQRAVLAHLAWRGGPNLFAFHCPNGGWRSSVEAAILKGLGVVPGVPDILIVSAGQLFGLELKAPGGRLSSNAQVLTQARMAAAGAIIGTAKGVDEALEWLAQRQLLRPTSGVELATRHERGD